MQSEKRKFQLRLDCRVSGADVTPTACCAELLLTQASLCANVTSLVTSDTRPGSPKFTPSTALTPPLKQVHQN